MAQAIKLARRGKYTTSPNPNVGCIIVDTSGRKVGEGAHLKAGEPHAEVHALRQAAEKASNGTAYVTLEPCSHYGKTPPCVDALISANVARVVIANTDPNPKVNGNGVKRLQNAGIKVQTGLLENEAMQLNLGFFKRMQTGMPWVRVKMAASLDGRTALANGESQWITGPDSRRDVQHFRASSCAVLTGSGTVRKDNPSLLVRTEQAQFGDYPLYAVRQPLRVVLEGRQALHTGYQLFNDGYPVWLVSSSDLENNEHINRTLPTSVLVKKISQPDSVSPLPDLSMLLEQLGQQGCNDIWVEAGPTLAGAFIEQGLCDELIVYLAGKLMGHSALPLVNLPEFNTLIQVPEFHLKNCTSFGNDVRLTYTLTP